MTWDEVWSTVKLVFDELSSDVKAGARGIAEASGRTTAASFPFGAYLSFGIEGDATREDVVISVDCKRDDEALLFTCDIARGDGYVLRDGPTLLVSATDVESAPDVDTWLAEVAAFLRTQSKPIIAELSARGRDV